VLQDIGVRGVGVGADVFAAYRYHSCFLGAQGATTLTRPQLERAEGTVELERSAITARLGCALPLSRYVQPFVSAGAGAALYRVTGNAVAGYSGEKHSHSSGLLQIGVGANFWFSEHVGAYIRLDASSATAAPSVRVAGRQIALLERAMIGASVGLALRL